MNLPTIIILLILAFSYFLALRSVCKDGFCADCGARNICPAHALKKTGFKRPNAQTLARARREALHSERPPLIVNIKENRDS